MYVIFVKSNMINKYINADRLKEVPIFNGKYDKKANEDFIFGIETVIEYIDTMSGEDVLFLERDKNESSNISRANNRFA